MVIQLDDDEIALLKLIGDSANELGTRAFVIGGFVRDRYLGKACKDIDIVCEMDGIQLAHQFATKLKPIPEVHFFKNFGTAMVKYQDISIEFVGARKESYQQDSRKPEVEAGTIEDDQLRRDFTINALAVSLQNISNENHIIDPFGGLKDIAEGIIRTPIDPDKTFFDDPLRIMRAVRFANQLNYRISDEVFVSIRRNKERISIVSFERVIGELEKIIMTSKPSYGFKLLDDCGVLNIIFPELTLLKGVESRNGIRHKDNFYHTLQVLDNLAMHSDNYWLRWSAILHDIAKPATKKFHSGIGWTFHGHEYLGSVMVPRIFKRMKLPLDHSMRYVQKLVKLHLRPISLTKEDITDSAVRRLLFEAGDGIDDLMLLCKADITSKNDEKVARYLENYEILRRKLIEIEEKDKVRNWKPPISGHDIMTAFNIKEGKEVGLIKSAIRDSILDGIIPNEYDAAYQLMLVEGQKLGLQQA